MLLTPKETAYVLGIKPKAVYYLIYMSYLDGVKIRGWKITSESVEEYVKRQCKAQSGTGTAGDYGLSGCDKRLEDIRKNALQADSAKRAASVERRRRRMEHSSARRHKLSGQAQRHVRRKKCSSSQLWFDF